MQILLSDIASSACNCGLRSGRCLLINTTMSSSDVLARSLSLVDDLMTHTAYEDVEDGREMFVRLRDDLEKACESQDGGRVIHKFDVLCRAVSTRTTYDDMVKIIWRMVKAMRGGPLRRLSLFLLAVSSVVQGLVSRGGDEAVISEWVQLMCVWLGRQLVTGGKGVEEVPEGKQGNAQQRLARFFATPYLHDYD